MDLQNEITNRLDNQIIPRNTHFPVTVITPDKMCNHFILGRAVTGVTLGISLTDRKFRNHPVTPDKFPVVTAKETPAVTGNL